MNEQEQYQREKKLALRPMFARYFNHEGEEIEEESVAWKLGDDAFRLRNVGDAKAVGRRIDARGFRIWLGKEAEKRAKEDPTYPHTLFYIRIDRNSRFKQVGENGFVAYFENLIHSQIRRKNIQLLRAGNDPAYTEKPSKEEREERKAKLRAGVVEGGADEGS